LAGLTDAALTEQLVALALALRDIDAAPLARFTRLPLGEVVASPFALRAVALAVESGARAVHLELRARPDWPEALGVASEVRDPEHGVWDRGVLKSGKYQGFLADEAFATYDPSHVSKWGPHELLHRAAGCFHVPGASRWEHYVGARLNELVPVVTWYGPEQAMRLDEGAFDRVAAGRSPRAPLEEAHWRSEDEAALRARAARSASILRAGLDHFERELAAIDRELVHGRRVRVVHPLLDASSDATAYVVGHFDRLCSPAVEAVLAVLPDAFVTRDVGAYRDRIEALFDRLLFAPITVDFARAEAQASMRGLWDVLHRVAHLGEGMDGELEPFLDEARRELASGEVVDVRGWRDRLTEGLADEEAALVRADGWSEPALAQLADGLASAVPCTAALLGDEGLEALASAEALWDRAPLAARVERWLTSDDAVRELCRFERALVDAGRDDQVERLAVPIDELPEHLDEGRVVRNEGFAIHAFEHAVVDAHASIAAGEEPEPPAPGPGRWLIGGFFGDVAVLPCPAAVAEAWAALSEGALAVPDVVWRIDAALGDAEPIEGWPEDGAAWVRELLEAGALGWMP
jgi:hypothetical protein